MMLITTLGPDCVIDHWSEHVPSILADMNYETAFVYWYLTSGKLDVSRIVGILARDRGLSRHGPRRRTGQAATADTGQAQQGGMTP